MEIKSLRQLLIGMVVDIFATENPRKMLLKNIIDKKKMYEVHMTDIFY